MKSCPVERVVRIIGGVDAALTKHESTCGDRVIGIALNPGDHDELCIAEIWGLPVLAWDEVGAGKLKLLCEANEHLIPQIHTLEDLLDRWQYNLEAPAA